MNTELLNTGLHALFDEQLADRECFGGAAAVLVNGETLFDESFGDAARFNENSLYRMASLTKIFTAAVIMRLCEEKRLNISEKVSAYLPEFAGLKIGGVSPKGYIYSLCEPNREITLFDLLTHTAGLGAGELGNREYTLLPPEVQTDLAAVTDYYAKNFHLAFEPGEHAAYSGFVGYDVLARIAEVVCRKPFGELLREKICAPLGMNDTTFRPNEEQYARLVPMHKRIAGEDREIDFHGCVFRGVQPTYEMAGASLVSSMHDCKIFCRMLLCGGELDGVRVLTAESVNRMLSPALQNGLDGLPNGENNGFGCFQSVGMHRLPKGYVFSHGAYGTHLLLRPDDGFAAIFLKNSYLDMSTAPRSTVLFEKAVLAAKRGE